MAAKLEFDPETHHPRTGARRTTTSETATPSKAAPPSVRQVLAAQKPDEEIDKHGNVTKTAAPLPAPIELTDAQRAENLRKNMAAVGTMPMTFITFEGVKNIYEVDDSQLPQGGIYLALVRLSQHLFKRFHGPQAQPDVMGRRIDEPLLTRDDLDGGYDEEDGEYGRRYRWNEEMLVPLVDASGGGGELYAFQARNVTACWR
jgi:hypothetical protein